MEREKLKSRLGFILLSAGCAIYPTCKPSGKSADTKRRHFWLKWINS